MRQYYYELHDETRAEIEQNTLFAENLDVAIEFFEALYLDLHLSADQRPDLVVLRSVPTGEELLRYALHWDVVAES